MGYSRYLNEQQAEAPPPRKYELPEEDRKAGLLRIFSVGLLLSGVFVLLKDVLFNWGEASTARADSATKIDPGNGNIEPPSLVVAVPPSLVVVETLDQTYRDAVEQQPKPFQSRANSRNSSIDSFFTSERPDFDDSVQVRSSSSLPLAARNDIEPAGPAVGSDVNGLPPQVGSGSAASGTGNGGGGFGGIPNSDGDTAIDNLGLTVDPRPAGNPRPSGDPRPAGNPRQTGNRAPVVTGPARLDNLLVNQTLIIATAGLLQNATDPDGDVLSIRDLVASSGNLVDTGNGAWSFTPDPDDTTEVTFTYNVSDGTESTPQTALLDLLPLPGKTPGKTYVGTDAPDTIIGTPFNDIIDARGGDDTVIARGGEDVIHGGDGDDRILAGEGDDVVFGGAGDDTIFGGGGDDVVFGGAGDDTIFGGAGDDVVSGGAGDDTIFGDAGDDVVSGGAGDDTIFGGAGDDVVSGGDGDDTIFGGDGNDVILGGNDHDLIVAGAGDDIVDGGAGDDKFIATNSDGDDSYSGGAGTDTYDLSGTGAGVVVDLALGTADGAEIGHDSLSSIENVIGGDGDDVFKANEFFNVFTGGGGNDTYEFSGLLNAKALGAVRDQITDFHVGDKIDLSGFDSNWMLLGNPDFELVVDKLEFSDSGKIEIRFESFGEDERTVVEGKIDENGEFDFEIELHGHHDLTKDDFIGVS